MIADISLRYDAVCISLAYNFTRPYSIKLILKLLKTSTKSFQNDTDIEAQMESASVIVID